MGEDSSSEEEEEENDDAVVPQILCEEGEHKWAHNVCMVCFFCGYCTGYGPGCCNEGSAGREPGG